MKKKLWISISCFLVVALIVAMQFSCTERKKYYAWPIHPDIWFERQSMKFIASDGKEITVIRRKVDSSYSAGGFGGSYTHWWRKSVEFQIVPSWRPKDSLKGSVEAQYNDVSKHCSVEFHIDSFDLEIEDYMAFLKKKYNDTNASTVVFSGFTTILQLYPYGNVDTFMLCKENEMLAIRINNKIFRSQGMNSNQGKKGNHE